MICLSRNLCDRVVPGNRVTVIGIYSIKKTSKPSVSKIGFQFCMHMKENRGKFPRQCLPGCLLGSVCNIFRGKELEKFIIKLILCLTESCGNHA